ncbi:MAG: DUF4282 domain-containing protein [Desulfonatronovibrionaceae bacterium]
MQGSDMLADFLTFQSVISPHILMFVYYLGAVACPVIMILAFRKAKENSAFLREGKGKRVAGVLFLLLIVGELAWRMLLEFLIAYFQIREALV